MTDTLIRIFLFMPCLRGKFLRQPSLAREAPPPYEKSGQDDQYRHAGDIDGLERDLPALARFLKRIVVKALAAHLRDIRIAGQVVRHAVYEKPVGKDPVLILSLGGCAGYDLLGVHEKRR